MAHVFDVPGSVDAVHEIDGITIIEYTEGGVDQYRVFVDGEDTGVTVDSLTHAIVFGVAFRYDGEDTSADIYFMRMIGAEDEE